MTPIKPTNSWLYLISKSTVSKFKQLLFGLMEDWGVLVELIVGMVTALQEGILLWYHEVIPRNLSFFSFARWKSLSFNTVRQAMVPHLKVTKGRGCSDEDIKESIKQGVEVPTDTESLKHQFNNTTRASNLFFLRHPLLATWIFKMAKHVNKNLLAHEAR